MATRGARQIERVRATAHEGFLRHRNYRWLKVGLLLSVLAIVGYAMIDVYPRHNGGSWYGYTLGTIGALLILWLTMLGMRKRAMTRGAWSLKGWTSAHVYLGLSLLVIGTLHTGFQFGWNVHTLAYALMMLVIVSGIYGSRLCDAAGSAERQSVGDDQVADDRRDHQARPPAAGRRAAAEPRRNGDRPAVAEGGSVPRRPDPAPVGQRPRVPQCAALRELRSRLALATRAR
jgi:hypothetical protein